MNIKKSILAVLGILFAHCGFSQGQIVYDIKGHVPDLDSAFFVGDFSNPVISDSAYANDGGNFRFKGTNSNVTKGVFYMHRSSKKNPYEMFLVYTEPGNINVTVDSVLGGLRVGGTPSNDIMQRFKDSQIGYFTGIKDLYDSINAINYKLSLLRRDSTSSSKDIKVLEERDVYFQNLAAPLSDQYIDAWKQAIFQYPNTYFAVGSALDLFSYLSSDSVKKVYNSLDASMQNSALGIQLKNKIAGITIAADNTPAPLFSSVTLSGNKISIKSFQGKYLLLDFWATWCAPCRAGNPDLIKLFNQYHSKGLEIVGISDDDNNINGWKNAVKKDNIDIWHQILRQTNNVDSSGRKVDVAKLYNVPSYPTKILIDPNGVIVGHYHDDNELANKLAELLK